MSNIANNAGLMEENFFSRTRLLLGESAIDNLTSARVAVFGVGGVGGYVVEALARSGVGAIDLIDSDTVSESNLNRQIIALRSNIGQPKVEIAKKRILDINPDCKVTVHQFFYLPETADKINFSDFDYIVDAVDTVTAKLNIIKRAYDLSIPVISSMGAGNKLDPSAFEVADIYKTSVCPLAKVIRRECTKLGIKHLKTVYSKEKAAPVTGTVIGSVSFVPGACGLVIAGEVIKDIAKGRSNESK